jgi:hypothetical protein
MKIIKDFFYDDHVKNPALGEDHQENFLTAGLKTSQMPQAHCNTIHLIYPSNSLEQQGRRGGILPY